MLDANMWETYANYVRTRGYPTQQDPNSCGVFVMMYVAYLMSGHETSINDDVKMSNMDTFRQWLTRMLCEAAVGAPV